MQVMLLVKLTTTALFYFNLIMAEKQRMVRGLMETIVLL